MSQLTSAPLAQDASRQTLRWGVYFILIAVATGNMVGRIFAVNSVDMIRLEARLVDDEVAKAEKAAKEAGEPFDKSAAQAAAREKIAERKIQRPFLSANDRSRWCTIRALVELDPPRYAIEEILSQPSWDTIDMVAHEYDGEMHLYSSKPPLYPTLVAGLYWVIYHVTGASLETHPYEVGRTILILVNVLPLIAYFVLLARMAERWGTTDWGRMFVVAAGTLGTFLNTFAVVLNNHVPAAVCALVAIYAALRIWYDGERRLRYFAVAGLFATLTVADELPALSLLGLLGAGLLWKAPRPTMLGFVPPMLVVVAAYFGANYAAHAQWLPAYAERHVEGGWYDYEYFKTGGDSPKVFPGVTRKNPGDQDLKRGRIIESYWRAGKPVGIDKGEESQAVYALHALVGHHGIFSLTPVWLLSVASLGIWLFGSRPGQRLTAFAAMVATISIVVIAFYINRPQDDRNYGGMTSGLRWAFWMAPLWLAAMLPAADWLAERRWRRGLGYVLLGLSVLSAAYPIWNPWTHPWLMNFFLYLGWTNL